MSLGSSKQDYRIDVDKCHLAEALGRPTEYGPTEASNSSAKDARRPWQSVFLNAVPYIATASTLDCIVIQRGHRGGRFGLLPPLLPPGRCYRVGGRSAGIADLRDRISSSLCHRARYSVAKSSLVVCWGSSSVVTTTIDRVRNPGWKTRVSPRAVGRGEANHRSRSSEMMPVKKSPWNRWADHGGPVS
jgi:hypothetical protein